MRVIHLLRYQALALIAAVGVIFLAPAAFAQSSGGAVAECEAGLLSRFASGFFSVFEVLGLREMGINVCFLNQLLLGFIALMMAVSVVYSLVMLGGEQSRPDC